MENEVSKNIMEKSFIQSGDTFIDIKQMASFQFKPDKKGYLLAVYRPLDNPEFNIITHIADKNELSQLFLELEYFFEDPSISDQLRPLIEKMDNMRKNYKK